jgi:branched-chain amino acid transport system ATP-binding protein
VKQYDKVLLSCENLDIRRDGIVKIVRGISLEVGVGEFVSIVGSNGTGKSTILKAISGIKKLHSGQIWFDGKRIDGLEPQAILKKGISYCPEGRLLFSHMTVEDNLKIGAFIKKYDAKVKEDIEEMYDRFPVLGKKRHQYARQISGAQQMLLSIARSIMSKPKLLLIDEPSQGMSPLVIKDIAEILKKFNEKGLTILLVGQNAKLCFKLANRAYLVEMGEVVLKGDAKEMAKNPKVQNTYLGMD